MGLSEKKNQKELKNDTTTETNFSAWEITYLFPTFGILEKILFQDKLTIVMSFNIRIMWSIRKYGSIHKEALQVQQSCNNYSKRYSNCTNLGACEITCLFLTLGIFAKDTISGYTHYCYVLHCVINLKAWLNTKWDVTSLTLVQNVMS